MQIHSTRLFGPAHQRPLRAWITRWKARWKTNRVPLTALVAFLFAGCSTPLEKSPFCVAAAVNTFEKSDGPSAPLDLDLTLPRSIVVVQALGQWEQGGIALEIWDENGIPVWHQPLTKSDKPQTFRSAPLGPGKYRLVNFADAATRGTICMTETIEAAP